MSKASNSCFRSIDFFFQILLAFLSPLKHLTNLLNLKENRWMKFYSLVESEKIYNMQIMQELPTVKSNFSFKYTLGFLQNYACIDLKSSLITSVCILITAIMFQN